MPFSLRRILPIVVVAALLGGALIPVAGAAGPDASANAAAKKKSKCKKGKKSKSKKKGKKCKKRKRSLPTSPGLPGQALTPGTPTAPVPPPPPEPATVGSLTVDPPTVLAGDPADGVVTISAPAPAGGQPVALSSDQPSRVSVPASAHIAAGQTSVGFQIDTTDGATVTATITGSIGSSFEGAQLTAVADPSVVGVALDYQCFPGTGLTDFGVNRVFLDVPAPADEAVSLASSDPFSLDVDPEVFVPTGTNSAIFGVDTFLVTPSVSVEATLGTSTAADTASVRDTATPSAVSGLTLSPETVAPGGTATGTVTLDCEALSGGAVVTLASDNAEVLVPPSVTVLDGDLSGSFTITTTAAATGEAVITATLGGPVVATLTINLLDT